MSSLSRARIVVLGAGALGLASAAVLARRGARVTVIDDAPAGGNASAIAAGMIAPGLEAALEGEEVDRAALYRAAAEMWPGFAADFSLDYVREGADWRGLADPMATRLDALGVAFEAGPGGLYIPEEGRVSPRVALKALAAGVERITGRVEAVDGRSVRLGDDGLAADAVVLATGWRAAALAAPGLKHLLERVTPVKGQILLLDRRGAVDRTTRGEGVYLVPTESGVLAGATMETGVSDTATDPAAVEQLRAAATALEPRLADAMVVRAMAGVRGATPDGLPMAGATAVEGVFVALAPRRNGWLLAPLVAEAVAAAIAQKSPPPFAGAFRPDRFDPA